MRKEYEMLYVMMCIVLSVSSEIMHIPPVGGFIFAVSIRKSIFDFFYFLGSFEYLTFW